MRSAILATMMTSNNDDTHNLETRARNKYEQEMRSRKALSSDTHHHHHHHLYSDKIIDNQCESTKNCQGKFASTKMNIFFDDCCTYCTDFDYCSKFKPIYCHKNSICELSPLILAQVSNKSHDLTLDLFGNKRILSIKQTFICKCPRGFQGDASNSIDGCKDIDECEDKTMHRCSENGSCENLIGSHKCTCNKGYYGDGIDCFKIQTNTTFHGQSVFDKPESLGLTLVSNDDDDNNNTSGSGSGDDGESVKTDTDETKQQQVSENKVITFTFLLKRKKSGCVSPRVSQKQSWHAKVNGDCGSKRLCCCRHKGKRNDKVNNNNNKRLIKRQFLLCSS